MPCRTCGIPGDADDGPSRALVRLVAGSSAIVVQRSGGAEVAETSGVSAINRSGRLPLPTFFSKGRATMRVPVHSVILSGLIATVCLSTAGATTHTPTKVQLGKTWARDTVAGMPVGYSCTFVTKATFRGKKAYLYITEVHEHSHHEGSRVNILQVVKVYLGLNLVPLQLHGEQVLKHSDNRGPWVTLSALRWQLDFDGASVNISVIKDGKRVTKTVSAPGDVSKEWQYSVTANVRPGTEGAYWTFNPASFSYQQCRVSVGRPARVAGLGPAPLIEEVEHIAGTSHDSDDRTWYSLEGRVKREEWPGPFGLTVCNTCTKAEAMRYVRGDGPDVTSFAILLPFITSGKTIAFPRETTAMVVRLAGFPPSKQDHNTDARQSCLPVPGSDAVEYSVRVPAFSSAQAAQLPIRKQGFSPWLEPTKVFQSDNDAIKQQARSVIGSEANAYLAARKLCLWVSRNVKDCVSDLPDAVSILRAKKGVCFQHAILYVAMARAAGIPTRMVAGLVYANGTFVLHAWAESYVGKWVTVDPTFGMIPCDATYIKLAFSDGTENSLPLSLGCEATVIAASGGANDLPLKQLGPLDSASTLNPIPVYPGATLSTAYRCLQNNYSYDYFEYLTSRSISSVASWYRQKLAGYTASAPQSGKAQAEFRKGPAWGEGYRYVDISRTDRKTHILISIGHNQTDEQQKITGAVGITDVPLPNDAKQQVIGLQCGIGKLTPPYAYATYTVTLPEKAVVDWFASHLKGAQRVPQPSASPTSAVKG